MISSWTENNEDYAEVYEARMSFYSYKETQVQHNLRQRAVFLNALNINCGQSHGGVRCQNYSRCQGTRCRNRGYQYSPNLTCPVSIRARVPPSRPYATAHLVLTHAHSSTKRYPNTRTNEKKCHSPRTSDRTWQYSYSRLLPAAPSQAHATNQAHPRPQRRSLGQHPRKTHVAHRAPE